MVARLNANGWMADMRVRITRNMTGVVDGIRLDRFGKGYVYEVGSLLGSYLLACGCAEPVSDDTPATVVPSSERVLTLREYLDGRDLEWTKKSDRTSLFDALSRQIRLMRYVQVIIAANRLELVPELRRECRTSNVEIIIDRRRRKRRRSPHPDITLDRRHGDRRVHDISAELDSVGFAVNVISQPRSRRRPRSAGSPPRKRGGVRHRGTA